ncbi:phage tail tape measure protein [Micrococcus luteus]|uniref:phage tail tape measure protein n=1 Tax=Micrococcus luteus TaxID=1270 RepID=UPI003D7595E4
MADRSISLSLRAKVEGFVAGMHKAKKAAEDLGQSTSRAAADSEASARKIEQAAAAVAKAQDRAKDAAGRLKVAEAELSRARDSGSTVAVTRAEERLAKAQRDSESAAKRAADAQKAYRGALQASGTQVETIAEKVERASASMEQVGGALLGAGGLLAAGAGMTVKTAADFDKAMSSVRAATHETEENMALLGEAAKKAGADTAYSAEEAAQGIEEMAKAGVSTEEILGGGLDGALALAAAGALDVGDAAELAASALVQFKLDGSQIPHVADLLAAGAGKAQGSVEDLGAALNQSGLIAAQTGLDVEETTGALAMFANAGLTGSDAGTSFKTMLQRLNPQSKEAAQLMEELGLSAYDANGNFIGMEEYAGKLQGALAGMSEQQRSAALQTLFGSDAIRAASVLYEGGAEGVREWTEKVNDAGYAAETASIMQDNLAGDLEKLGGAFDTVFLQSGSGANDVLRDMVQGLEGVVDWVGSLPEGVLQIGTVFAGVTGGAALLAGATLTVIPKIKETRDALNDLAPAGSKSAAAIGKLGKLAGVASVLSGVALAAIELAKATTSYDTMTTEKMATAIRNVANAGDDVVARKDQLNSVFSDWDVSAGSSAENIMGMDQALQHLVSSQGEFGRGLNDWANDAFAWTGLAKDNVGQVEDRLMELGNEMGNLASSGETEAATAAFQELARSWEATGRPAEELFNTYMPGLRDSLKGVAAEMGVNIDDAQALEWALSGVAPEAVRTAEASADAEAAMAKMAAEAEAAAQKSQSLVDELAQTTGINPDGLNGMAEAMAILTDESEEAGDKLDKVIDALFRAGLAHMSVQDAQAAMYEAGDALNKAIEENAASLDLSTEAGRANVDALQGVAVAGFDAARAYAEAGKSQGTIRDALMETYEQLVAGYEAMGQSSEAADTLARQMMGIPEGVDIATSMDQQARIIAESTGEAIDAIPGYKGVTVAVSEEGTAGSVQQSIDEIDGVTRTVFVTTDGTEIPVQEAIRNVHGVERTVWVDDQGTVYGVQTDIDAITGKTVDLTAVSHTADAEGALNYAARSRTVSIFAKYTGIRTLSDLSRESGAGRGTVLKPGLAEGGIASLPGFSAGGRLPRTGLGTDMILGVTGSGTPIARVDDGEWIINQRSSAKWGALLDAINRDDPRLMGLPAFAGGGRVGAESLASSMSVAAARIVAAANALAVAMQTANLAVRAADTAGNAPRSKGRSAPKANTHGSSAAWTGSTRGYDKGTRDWVSMIEPDRKARAKQGWNVVPWEYVAGTPGADHGDHPWETLGPAWMRQLERRYGPIFSGAIHEDWSGRVFFKDGRQIMLDSGGAWRWVSPKEEQFRARAFNGKLLRDFYPKFAAGGRLPGTGRGTDQILGVTGDGTPLAWLDDHEWVVNADSADRYPAALDLINRDHPSVHHLRGRAAGEITTPSWSSYAPAPQLSMAAPAAAPAVDLGAVYAAARAGAESVVHTIEIDRRQFASIVQRNAGYTAGR